MIFDPGTLAIIDFNDAACRRLGYSRKEFARLRISDFDVHESPRETVRHAGRITGRRVDVFMTKHRTKSGALLDVEVRASAVMIGRQKVIQGVWRDVSRQMEIEEELRQSEALLERTQRISGVGGWELDLITKRGSWTDETYRIHGVSRDTYALLSVEQTFVFYDGDDQRRMKEAFCGLVKDGKPYDLEVRFTSADGRRLWVRTIGRAERRDGKVVRVFGNIMDITALKQAQASLIASESKYRLIAEHTSDVVWTMDLEGKLTYVSPTTLSLSGFTAEEMLSMPLDQQVAPGSLQTAIETLGALIEKGRQGIVGCRTAREIEQLRKDGSTVWTDVVCDLVRDDASDSIVIIGVARDISARKKVEKALKASENHYRMFTENASDVVWTMDLDGRFTYVGPTTFKLRGYTAEEVLCQPLDQQIAPGSLQVAAEAIGALIANGRKGMTGWRTSREIEQLRKDGSGVWTEVVCDLVRDEASGSIIILGVTRDITERRQAAEALRRMAAELERRVEQRTAELQQSMVRLETILSAARVVAWELDPVSGEVIETGPVAEIFGKPKGFRHPNIATFLESAHPDDREMLRATVEDAIKRTAGYSFVEYRVLFPDGSIHWILTSGTVERDADGTAVRLRGITRDITDLRKVEEERAQLQRQVLDISEREQRRIGQDLHDGVGQSLAGISYLISAVQQDLATCGRPEAAELERIAQVVGKTVQQSHDMAQGLIPVELGKAGFADVLHELAIHTQNIFGIPCRCSGPNDVRLGDESVAFQAYRIVQEAVHNSAKHSKTKSINIRLSKKRSSIVLEVSDTGTGIMRATGGREGLGLRIMRHRADMIGAKLTIESEQGKGTTVTCVIPLLAREKEAVS